VKDIIDSSEKCSLWRIVVLFKVILILFSIPLFADDSMPQLVLKIQKPSGCYDFSKSKPAVADIDSNSRYPGLEIVTNCYSDKKLYAWHASGVSVARWPQQMANYGFEGGPVAADIDGDPSTGLEVAYAPGATRDAGFYVWQKNKANNIWKTLVGWPPLLPSTVNIDNISSSIAAANIDMSSDGKLELVAADMSSRIFVLDSTGQLLPGWPVSTGEGGFWGASPVIADIYPSMDGLEIVIGNPIGLKVHAFSRNGIEADGFPKKLSGSPYATPAIGDLDGDGTLEIVAAVTGSVLGYDDNPRIYAWHADVNQGYTDSVGNVGTVQGWPIKITESYARGQELYGHGCRVAGIFASPALADFDDDGKLEVVAAADDGTVYVWNYKGELYDANKDGVADWPQSVPFDWQTDQCPFTVGFGASPAIADVNDDGRPEIVIPSKNGKIYAWKPDGTLLPTESGWPLVYDSRSSSSPVIADLKNDGKLYVIVGGYDYLYVWRLPQSDSTNNKMPWPMFHHDAQHTGRYTPPNHPPVVNVNGPSSIIANENEEIDFNIEPMDPDGDPLTITWSVLSDDGLSRNSLPEGVGLDKENTYFSWRPTYDQGGKAYHFIATADDGKGGVTEQKIDITVLDVNRSPTITLSRPSSITANIGDKIEFYIKATDPDRDKLTITWSNLPHGATIEKNTYFFWQPTEKYAGTYKVTATASDGKGGVAQQVITITVSEPNYPPAFNFIPNQTIKKGSAYSLQVTVTDSNPNDIVKLSAVKLPVGASFVMTSAPGRVAVGRLTWAWTPASAGTSGNFFFVASDGKKTVTKTVPYTVESRYVVND